MISWATGKEKISLLMRNDGRTMTKEERRRRKAIKELKRLEEEQEAFERLDEAVQTLKRIFRETLHLDEIEIKIITWLESVLNKIIR